jgi:5-methylthioribose kinase
MNLRLDANNAAQYLRSRGHIGSLETIDAHELSGGVSNVVHYVSRSLGGDFVLKQGREQLQVAEPWFCSVERIWREIEVLRICEQLTASQPCISPLRLETPRLLFEDRENHLYAMTAAPQDHVVWKSELLSGRARVDVAESSGVLLGLLHSKTWHDRELAHRLDDRQYFDVLRLDPYYRQVARVHLDLRPALEKLIHSVWDERHCLVHGDFSPKNLLVYGDCLMLIDFEVGHYGDPAFDVGFFLSHLMLKAFYHAPLEQPYFGLVDSFWKNYLAVMSQAISLREIDQLIRRSILNFAGCALARLDGKSKIDYLTQDERRQQMRRLCRAIIAELPPRWADVAELARKALANGLAPISMSAKGND